MNYLNAFWVGGLICALCQVLIDKTKLTPARVLVSLVVLGVILQGLGWYQAVVTTQVQARLCRCSASDTRWRKASPKQLRRTVCSACSPAA